MQKVQKPAFILLFLLISFGSITAVAYTPALPQIATFFGVSSKTASITMTIFLVGYALGQLLYGPLANRFGRKKALFFGIALEMISSLLCVAAASLHTFWLLVAARFTMALGASVGLKMSFTLVADTHSQAESRRTIGYLMTAFAVTPPLGIAIGGFLLKFFAWTSVFYFMALYGVVVLLCVFKLTETVSTLDYSALQPKRIIHKYAATLKNATLPLASSILGLGTSFVYVFATIAPFIGIQMMGLSPADYGLWCLLPSIGIIMSSQLSAMLSNKLSPMCTIFIGMLIMTLAVSTMLGGFILGHITPTVLFVPQVIIYVGMGLVFANASNIAMSSIADKASASAMQSFFNMGIATLCVLGVGILHMQTTLFLPIIYCSLTGLAVILAIVLAYKMKKP